MNVLITGGAGFIGSHVAEACLAEGHRVAVLDNLSTGQKDQVPAGAAFFQCDLGDDEVKDVFERVSPDVVIHLAAQIDVRRSIELPRLDAEVNILGSLALLEHCRRHSVRKLVYASSAAVYGRPQTSMIDENHRIAPLSGYGVSKYTAEQYIHVFADLYDLDYTILRYANVYGERQNASGEAGVVSIFAELLRAGARPIIHGTGEQTRDFIHVKDVARANLAALHLGARETLNIGSRTETSILQLLQLMGDLAGRPVEPEFAPPRSGDIDHSCLDNRQAKIKLGWEPTLSLADGLAELLGVTQRKSAIG